MQAELNAIFEFLRKLHILWEMHKWERKARKLLNYDRTKAIYAFQKINALQAELTPNTPPAPRNCPYKPFSRFTQGNISPE